MPKLEETFITKGEVKRAMDKQETRNKQKFEKGVGVVRCPERDCKRILMEADESKWKDAPGKLICRKCENGIAEVFYIKELDRPLREMRQYFCQGCEEEFTRNLTGTKHYCSGCKRFYAVGFLVSSPRPVMGLAAA